MQKSPRRRKKKSRIIHRTKVGADDLLGSESAVAAACGIGRWTVTAVKKASRDTDDNPFSGRFTTKRLFTDWILRHPKFRARHVMRKTESSPAKP